MGIGDSHANSNDENILLQDMVEGAKPLLNMVDRE